jgi:hypothetical protein
MAQPTVNITAPIGNTAVPVGATGTAQPSAGYQLCGMGYQIDSGSINPLPAGAFAAAGGPWNFQLQPTDCPCIGTQYVLTVWVGDSSGNFNSDSVNFTRTS